MPGCALRYCRNTSKNTAKSSGVTFHRFPRTVNSHKEEWINFVRTDRSEPSWSPTEHSYLCSDHFREHDFIYTQTGRKFTKLSAVPSIPSEYKDVHPDSAPVEAGDEDVNMEEDAVKDCWDGRSVAVQPAVGSGPQYGFVPEEATRVFTECCVFGCRNNDRDNPDKRFYPLPSQPDKYKIWLKLINREDLATKTTCKPIRVCSEHFDVNDFEDHALKQYAIPLYQLPSRRKFIYDNPEAGPSASHDKQINTVNTEAQEIMEVDVKFDPEEQIPAHKLHLPRDPGPSSAETFIQVVDAFSLATNDSENPKITLAKKRKFLQRASFTPVEHMYLPGAPGHSVNCNSVHTQTTKLLLDRMNAPLKKKHEAEIRVIKNYIRAWERKTEKYARSPMGKKEFQRNCDVFLDEKFSTLVKFHTNMASNACGNRYSNEFKALVLNLFFSSPRAYSFVEKLFHLPSRATTIRTQGPIRTGVNAPFIEYFKAKVDKMSEKEKMCTVCFDYMKLNKNLNYCVNNDFLYGLHDIDQVVGTEPAEYATLIMVKGLYSAWKQPISFACVAEKKNYPELKKWLYKIIALLCDTGLNVKALIMNLGVGFIDYSEVSVAEPHFEVSGRKIYQIFDVPDLFKRARDALMKYDFHIGGKVIKWSYIINVYNVDKKRELRLVPKVTDAHVIPEKADDELKAIQVFSRTMAAAMNVHIIAKLMPEKAKDTVEFIQKLNNLFDILNSQKMTDENIFKQAYTGTEEQKMFLTNTFEYLKQLEIKDKRGNTVEDTANFVTGLLITIRSVVSLLEDLQKENFNYLMTKHFNIDCVNIYFDKVRDLGGNCCTKPTPIMFVRSFRRLFLVYLVTNNKGVSEMDLKTTLTKISEFVKVDGEAKEETEAKHNRFLKVVGGDCMKLWPKPGPTFTAGFLLSKCLKKHTCQKFLETLSTQYSDAPESLTAKFKEYSAKNLNKTDLLPPPGFIVNATLKMDKIFEDYIKSDDKDIYSFGWNIYLKMEAEAFDIPCQCFPIVYLKQLFIRMKIFHMVKHYNNNVKPFRRNKKQ